ncbi:MAG TPA: YggS family pyridoxal phosphate-dependent enzyme [Candidatus Dormibacteraeota bacterium]|nr:YggS family pyridoxal phosphate-dependent enzyme [Candidatus Dormibacteraeota bacterium]
MNVADNLRRIRGDIERAGRDPDEITIVAVTKGFGADMCREALSAGLTILGENRVQEALAKMDEVDGATWHLIGHLQSNKVKAAANRFALIQSLDSMHLAEALARHNSHQQVLVEVNVAREPQKSGVTPEHAVELVAGASGQLDVKGLMAMGPSRGDPTPAFEELRRIRDQAQERLGKALPILSMGMSGDYELALRAGSTMLRLGTALFGPRP